MLTTLLLSALLANGPGAIATVDDTNSHGAVASGRAACHVDQERDRVVDERLDELGAVGR